MCTVTYRSLGRGVFGASPSESVDRTPTDAKPISNLSPRKFRLRAKVPDTLPRSITLTEGRVRCETCGQPCSVVFDLQRFYDGSKAWLMYDSEHDGAIGIDRSIGFGTYPGGLH